MSSRSVNVKRDVTDLSTQHLPQSHGPQRQYPKAMRLDRPFLGWLGESRSRDAEEANSQALAEHGPCDIIRGTKGGDARQRDDGKAAQFGAKGARGGTAGLRKDYVVIWRT